MLVKVLGQIQSLRSFELATQPIAINGVMTVDAPLDFPFPSVIEIVQLGEIRVEGVLTFGESRFRFEDFTEGLPKGWYVDGPILETVPNPNYGTAYGNAFFRRWTWKGYDPAGTMVAASGSEQDCFAQTLAVCQQRHEDWRELGTMSLQPLQGSHYMRARQAAHLGDAGAHREHVRRAREGPRLHADAGGSRP